MFSTLQQPQPTIVLFNFESPPELQEEQFVLTERKLRTRPILQNGNREKVHLNCQRITNRKNTWLQNRKKIKLHQENRRNPYQPDQVRRSGSPTPRNARTRLEQKEKR